MLRRIVGLARGWLQLLKEIWGLVEKLRLVGEKQLLRRVMAAFLAALDEFLAFLSYWG